MTQSFKGNHDAWKMLKYQSIIISQVHLLNLNFKHSHNTQQISTNPNKFCIKSNSLNF
jgi:hypothetical protein